MDFKHFISIPHGACACDVVVTGNIVTPYSHSRLSEVPDLKLRIT